MRPRLVKLPSGAELEIWPNPGAASALFYPGSLLGPGQYACLLGQFRKAGFAVAALHLAGHGRNIKKPLHSFGQLSSQGLDAEGWLAENGFGPVVAAGHSQGGILALAHAAASPVIKAAFPVSAALPQLPLAIMLTLFAPFQKRRRQILTLLRRLSRLAPRLPIPLPLYIPARRLLSGRKRPIIMGKGPSRVSYPLEYLHSLFSAEIPPRLYCPLWLFSAKNDALFTSEITVETFTAIECPEKHLIWLENGGHMAPMNPDLARFIARTAAGACAGLGMPLNLEKDIAWL